LWKDGGMSHEDWEMLEDAAEKRASRAGHKKKTSAAAAAKTAPRSPLRLLWLGLGIVGMAFMAWALSQQGSAGPRQGDPAPDFILRGLDGQPIQLAGYRGQIVLLTFWASWCSTCRTEAPDLQALATEYQAQGVVVLGVNWQDTEPAARAFVQEFGLTYPNVLDPEGIAGARYGVQNTPTHFILNRAGIITNVMIGTLTHDAVAATLNRLLATEGTS
jgi:cytochrome c biogenesis protein CcmG, thiol:disulfide interchange protein DsbE